MNGPSSGYMTLESVGQLSDDPLISLPAVRADQHHARDTIPTMTLGTCGPFIKDILRNNEVLLQNIF